VLASNNNAIAGLAASTDAGGLAALIFCASLVLSTVVTAAPVSITSYDVEQTPRSGSGGWCHNYTGTITNTGRTVAGSLARCASGGNQIANYSGGSGTLDDGVVSTSLFETHLFTTRNADDGQPVNPRSRFILAGLSLLARFASMAATSAATSSLGRWIV